MDFEFRMLTRSFSEEVKLNDIRIKLAGKGRMVELGPRGLRFIPENRDWPATYFSPDGTIELVTKDLYLDDVMDFIDRLSLWIQVPIESDASRFGDQNI